jgi:succinate-semialdehyde dehydrogenase / glutarate-semialdehyde dehydrogenase
VQSHIKIGAITSKFRGSGQTCVCANRIYVQSTVYADFACRLAEKVSTFKVGDGLEEKTYYFGCVVNQRGR